MGLSDFLKNKTDVRSLADKISAETSNKSFEKKWGEAYFPNRGEDGSADVLIRFLPDKDGQLPYRLRYSHSFKGDDGRWIFYDVCDTTKGKGANCPVCAMNSKLWATGDPATQNEVRKRARKKNYMFNIVVLNDKRNPELNGKVMLYQCGPSIFNMILNALKPQYEDEEPKNVFDLIEGYNFRIRIRKDLAKGQITYEDSRFEDKPTALFDGNEKKLEEVYNQMKDLDEYLVPEDWQLNQDWAKKLKAAYSSYGVTLDEDAPVSKPAKAKKDNVEKEQEWDEKPAKTLQI